jgi:hypothetical protein
VRIAHELGLPCGRKLDFALYETAKHAHMLGHADACGADYAIANQCRLRAT